jgi:hypothetical protein
MAMKNATRFYNAATKCVMGSGVMGSDMIEMFSNHVVIVVRISPQRMEKFGASASGVFLGFDDGSGVIMVKETKTVLTILGKDMEEALTAMNHESNELLSSSNQRFKALFSRCRQLG